jgi:hypothetical protein
VTFMETRKFWNCAATVSVNTLNKKTTRYRLPVDHFALHPSLHIPHHCLAVTPLTFWQQTEPA